MSTPKEPKPDWRSDDSSEEDFDAGFAEWQKRVKSGPRDPYYVDLDLAYRYLEDKERRPFSKLNYEGKAAVRRLLEAIDRPLDSKLRLLLSKRHYAEAKKPKKARERYEIAREVFLLCEGGEEEDRAITIVAERRGKKDSTVDRAIAANRHIFGRLEKALEISKEAPKDDRGNPIPHPKSKRKSKRK